jgi:hypothetical protein
MTRSSLESQAENSSGLSNLSGFSFLFVFAHPGPHNLPTRLLITITSHQILGNVPLENHCRFLPGA